MLTPSTILDQFKKINKLYSKSVFGVYSPSKKITNFVVLQLDSINRNPKLTELQKVNDMLTLLEGFARYIKDHDNTLTVDVSKIITFIYYPDTEENTFKNKDNLLMGGKGQTVRLWHDSYFDNNRALIYNRFFDCKKFVSNNHYQYLPDQGNGMPDQMKKCYEKFIEERTHSLPLPSRRAG